MRVIAIDPGTTQSAVCIVDSETRKPLESRILNNEVMREYINLIPQSVATIGVIERFQSYGMPVGRDVFDAAIWAGRFYELLKAVTGREPEMVYRSEEKMHICHNSRAKDSNIRRALIDRFATHDFKNGRGTIKNPDWFYGFKKDMWAAYAVAVTLIETRPEVVGHERSCEL